jgi:beta-lactamase class A
MRFVRYLAWLLVLVAQPAWAQVSPGLQFLEQRLAALAVENPGEYGFAAMDLATGTTVSFNGQRAFPMASTMKIAVAATYLAEVDAGRRSLDDRIGSASAYRLMDLMITRSNNHATDQLMASLGGPDAIDRWLRRHGLSGIRVDRTIAQLLGDRRDLRDTRDSSTPTAMLNLLRLVDTGNALRPQSRALLMDMMRRCETGSNRIPALLPRHARVEHKTGTLNNYTSDVGYLTFPNGRRIAVAFFARYGSNRPAVIATAARAIYDTFAVETMSPWPRPWQARMPAQLPLRNAAAPQTAVPTGLAPGALPAGAVPAAAMPAAASPGSPARACTATIGPAAARC